MWSFFAGIGTNFEHVKIAMCSTWTGFKNLHLYIPSDPNMCLRFVHARPKDILLFAAIMGIATQTLP